METSGNKTFVKGVAVLAIAGLLCKVIGALFRIPLYNLLGDGMQYYEAKLMAGYNDITLTKEQNLTRELAEKLLPIKKGELRQPVV